MCVYNMYVYVYICIHTWVCMYVCMFVYKIYIYNAYICIDIYAYVYT